MNRLKLVFIVVVCFLPFILRAQDCPTNAAWEAGGTVNVPTDGSCDSPADDGLTCNPSTAVDNLIATINILACATVNFDDDGPVVLNGTMTIADGATVTTDGSFRVNGTLNVNGNLDVGDGGTGDNLAARAGGVINVASSGSVTVSGDVRNGAAGGGTINLNGNLAVTGNFDNLGAGSLTGTGYLTYGSFTDNGGSVGGSLSDCTADAGSGSCGDITLPVELTSFEGSLENNRVALRWSTSTEENNEGFFIEKSLDLKPFEVLGFVSGKGTTNEPQRYSFADYQAFTGSYYRLRQVDFDGKFEYSQTIYVSPPSLKGPLVEVYPNPSSGSVHFTGNRDDIFDLTLSDISGKRYWSLSGSSLAESEKILNMFLPSLQRGIYLISLSNTHSYSIIRLVLK